MLKLMQKISCKLRKIIYNRIRIKRCLKLAKKLDLINTEEELLNFYEVLKQEIFKNHNNKNSLLHFDVVLGTYSYLLDTGKKELVESEEVYELIQDIMFHLMT